MVDALRVDRSSNGRTVEVTVNQTIELTLPESRTAGFRWSVETSPEPICRISRDEFLPAGGPQGGTGTHRWSFDAVAPGTCAIRLSHSRPWEDKAAAGETFRLNVRVSKTP